MNVQVSIEEVPNSEQIFELLQGGFEKFVGLLGTEITAPPVLLLRCSSVHTFGMTYPIDIAFTDDHGEILKIRRRVQPKQIHSCAGAYCTFERPSIDDFPWFEVGQKVLIQEISTEESNVERRSRYGYRKLLRKNLPQMRRKAVSGHENLLRVPSRLQRPKLACMQSRNIKK